MRRLAVLILCACALPVSVAQAWTWPVDGPVLRPFSFDRAHPYAGGQHRGLDIGAATGTPVVAPTDGVVSFAGTVPSGGKTISIQTPSARYAAVSFDPSLIIPESTPRLAVAKAEPQVAAQPPVQAPPAVVFEEVTNG